MNLYRNYLENKRFTEHPPGKYKKKVKYLKRSIREYVHENAALVDEIEEIQTKIIIRMEERKFLLRKLCEYEPQTAIDVQNLAKYNSNQTANDDFKKVKKRSSLKSDNRKSKKKPKRTIQAIPLDGAGRPIYPIDLNNLKIHNLGEIIPDKAEYHTELAIYPVGYTATRIYGSLEDPTKKCIYTCKIEEGENGPKFIIDNDKNPIIGDTPDVCHSILLQRINDVLSLNVVSTRPRGHEFFGLTNSVVINLIQNLQGAKRCKHYRWNTFQTAFENSENDAGLNYEYLQRSINFVKYKMAPDVLKKPNDFDNKYLIGL